MDPVYVALLVLIALASGGVIWSIRYQRNNGYVSAEARLSQIVEKLEKEVARQKTVIDDLEERWIKSLQSEAEANRRIRELEGTLAQVRARVAELEAKGGQAVGYYVPLLHIEGNAKFGNSDRVALHKAEIRFKRLTGATRQTIESEIRRRRLDGTLYKWAIISAHMGDAGVLLEASADMVPPVWWNEHLGGLDVVFLNGCSSLVVADDLAGLVEVVVSLGEEVGNKDAADFAYAFWRRVKNGDDPGQAFESAINEVPAISEFADIRFG